MVDQQHPGFRKTCSICVGRGARRREGEGKMSTMSDKAKAWETLCGLYLLQALLCTVRA